MHCLISDCPAKGYCRMKIYEHDKLPVSLIIEQSNGNKIYPNCNYFSYDDIVDIMKKYWSIKDNEKQNT
jgi:hypothetical protein